MKPRNNLVLAPIAAALLLAASACQEAPEEEGKVIFADPGTFGIVAADEYWKEIALVHCYKAKKTRNADGTVTVTEAARCAPGDKPPAAGLVCDQTAQCWVSNADVPLPLKEGVEVYRYKISACPQGSDPKKATPPTDAAGWNWFATKRVNNMSAVYKLMSLPPTKQQFILWERTAKVRGTGKDSNVLSPVLYGKREVEYEAAGRNAAKNDVWWSNADSAFAYKDDNCPKPGARKRNAGVAGEECLCEICAEWGVGDCGECVIQPPTRYESIECAEDCVFDWAAGDPDDLNSCGVPRGDPACSDPELEDLQCELMCLPEF